MSIQRRRHFMTVNYFTANPLELLWLSRDSFLPADTLWWNVKSIMELLEMLVINRLHRKTSRLWKFMQIYFYALPIFQCDMVMSYDTKHFGELSTVKLHYGAFTGILCGLIIPELVVCSIKSTTHSRACTGSHILAPHQNSQAIVAAIILIGKLLFEQSTRTSLHTKSWNFDKSNTICFDDLLKKFKNIWVELERN